jgi:hypothetical protein
MAALCLACGGTSLDDPKTLKNYSTNDAIIDDWKDRKGNKERIKHLVLVRDKLRGEFKRIIMIASDENARVRRMKHCYADSSVKMRLTTFDETTGAFKAVRVD